MNLIKKWIEKMDQKINASEIQQCIEDGVDRRYSRARYNSRMIPMLYFTIDYSVRNQILFVKGDEYPVHFYNYERLVAYIKSGIISEKLS